MCIQQGSWVQTGTAVFVGADGHNRIWARTGIGEDTYIGTSMRRRGKGGGKREEGNFLARGL